jgi:hypothetical protein
MSLPSWRDPRYDFDAIQRAQRRQECAAEARHLAALIRKHPSEFRPVLLALLADDITDIALAVTREMVR